MRVYNIAFGLLLALGALGKEEANDGFRQLDASTLCSTDSNGLETCYPRVFSATTEFQAILPGQEVPPGLHIQIDMGTGQRQARLVPPADSGDGDVVELAVAHPVNEQVAAATDGHKDRTQVLADYIVDASSRAVDLSTEAQLTDMLDELKEIAYDPRQAERLMRVPGMVSALLQLSDPTHRPAPWPARARQLSSITLGTMVQNSPALQDLAFRANSVPLLVHSLRDERDARTAGKHVFALSALTRGHSQALEQFVHLGGLRILRDVNPLASPVFRSSDVEAEKLDMRVVRFVEDLLSSEINPHVPVSSATTIAQFAGVWCQTLVARLVESLEDVVSDGEAMIGPVYERRLVYMHSLQQLRLAHRNTCILPPRFGAWVQDELTRIGRLDSSGMEDYRQALNDLSAKGSV